MNVVPLPPRCGEKRSSPKYNWVCIGSPHPDRPEHHQFVRLEDDGYPVTNGKPRRRG